MPLKKPDKNRRDIKLKIKDKFKKEIELKNIINQYKTSISKEKDQVIKRYKKAMINRNIFLKRVDVLHQKGFFRQSSVKDKIMKKINQFDRISENIFFQNIDKFTKLKENSVPTINRFTDHYSKIITEVTQKSQKIMFIDDLNPVIDQAIKKLNNLFNKDNLN